ncbi:sugar-transfer associated ATP-grasp domain-containing protein [Haloarchaeobius sp. TZWWS8]|uniref:sugar-transfer associated ATP-grasp domain-containing protein n=1 Tax=Haloarchaeobius sp. TZWWS8 TaxID=3446121 RepID=UPI003EC0E94D
MALNPRTVYNVVRNHWSLVETERDTAGKFDRPLTRRLWLWRHGFLTRSDVLFDLDRHSIDDYLSDYERFVGTPDINGTWSHALDHKLVFHWMLGGFAEHRPTVYGLLRDGRFLPAGALHESDGTVQLTADGDSGDAATRVVDLLEREGDLVLKWKSGGGGNNVLLCSADPTGEELDGGDGDRILVNGDAESRDAFARRVRDLDDYLVCEFVEQASSQARLYPDTPNTIRMITMCDEKGSFVAMAIQRMGSDRSYPMDNFSQGGLNAEIDVETGELTAATQLPESGEPVWHETHPDTGSRIAGTEIPGWEQIRDKVLGIAAHNQHVPYVGWDVLPTDDEGGFTIVEGNSYPGTKAMQVHRPLLEDDRVRRFYDSHDVLVR